jgi:hypothetical protein
MRSMGVPYHVHAFIAETTGFTIVCVRHCSGADRVEGDALRAQSQMARRWMKKGGNEHGVMGMRSGRRRQRMRVVGGAEVVALRCAVKVVMSWR